ncbi:MAG: hypothetical protein QXV09_00475 [Candidatus Bathyarchaeia archaeon]
MQNAAAADAKNRPASRLAVSAVVFILVTLVAFLFVYLNTPREVPLTWDGGEWSRLLAVNCNAPTIVEFENKIYMFYSVITENAVGNTAADEEWAGKQALKDIMYVVFDGATFSSPAWLTTPNDEISVNGSFFVFQGKLYAALYEWHITANSTSEVKSRVRLEVFDGKSWSEAEAPLTENEMDRNAAPLYLVGSNKVWMIYQNVDAQGRFVNGFTYKTFNGHSWSQAQNFTIPTPQPNAWMPLVMDDQLWFAWDNVGIQADAQIKPHTDVWLGCFNGENWRNVTRLTPNDDEGENWGVTAVKYQGSLVAFWSSSYFKSPEPKDGGWVLRSFSLSDGALGELTPVPSEKGYKLSPWSTTVFEGRLYVLWYSDYENWRSMIAAFDGAQWSSLYRFDRGYDAEGLFVYKNKLWVYGTYESSKPNEAGWTYLRSYSLTG